MTRWTSSSVCAVFRLPLEDQPLPEDAVLLARYVETGDVPPPRPLPRPDLKPDEARWTP